MFRNIKCGILNLISWFKIIWFDRDWDYIFLLEILKFKLSKMAKLQRHYGNSESSEDIALEIESCVAALNRLIDNNYGEKEWQDIHDQWGEFVFEAVEDTPRYQQMSLQNIKTKEDEKKYSAAVKKVFKLEEEAVLKDLTLVFDTIKNRIRWWWD